MHGLVIPQINLTTKPQVLHRATSQNFLRHRYWKYSVTVSAVEFRNKIQKQKNALLQDLSPNKIKTVVSNFLLKSY